MSSIVRRVWMGAVLKSVCYVNRRSFLVFLVFSWTYLS